MMLTKMKEEETEYNYEAQQLSKTLKRGYSKCKRVDVSNASCYFAVLLSRFLNPLRMQTLILTAIVFYWPLKSCQLLYMIYRSYDWLFIWKSVVRSFVLLGS